MLLPLFSLLRLFKTALLRISSVEKVCWRIFFVIAFVNEIDTVLNQFLGVVSSIHWFLSYFWTTLTLRQVIVYIVCNYSNMWYGISLQKPIAHITYDKPWFSNNVGWSPSAVTSTAVLSSITLPFCVTRFDLFYGCTYCTKSSLLIRVSVKSLT